MLQVLEFLVQELTKIRYKIGPKRNRRAFTILLVGGLEDDMGGLTIEIKPGNGE